MQVFLFDDYYTYDDFFLIVLERVEANLGSNYYLIVKSLNLYKYGFFVLDMTEMPILEEILEGCEISDFSRRWIDRGSNDDEGIMEVYRILREIGLSDDMIGMQASLLGVNSEKIERNYEYLSRLGLSDDNISSQAQLLGMNPETIERNYQGLLKLGIKEDKIISQSHLLGRDPETIKRNYSILSELGLRKSKIATLAGLLGANPETIEKNYQNLLGLGLKKSKIATNASLLGRNTGSIERNCLVLSRLGLKDSKIASKAELLGMNPETIEKNYQHHVGLLRQNIEDRSSGRELLVSQAQLLGISPETINANVQYLYSLGIDYNNGFLLGTTPQKKREKMAWLLREVFDYRESENKKETIHRMYDFVRGNTRYLIKSIKTLEKEKYNIREAI